MKRLNPKTNLPFKQGDVREDGYIFKTYNLKRIKKDKHFVEEWCSPVSFEKYTVAVANYRKNNLDKVKALNANYYENNTNKVKSKQANWQKNNSDKVNALNAKRHSAKLKRTPPWLTDDHLSQMQTFYTKAKQLTVQTGIVHHVDHIVPLQGKTVSGLHVPWNLQVLTQSDNCSKSNRY